MNLKTLWSAAAVLTAIVASPMGSRDAAAQVNGVANQDLKPLYQTGEDIAQGKELAAATCAKCHGLDGAAPNPDVPNLAGQRAVYVFRVVKSFQTGAQPDRGTNHGMQLMKFFTDDALAKVAAYYANLEPAPPEAGQPPAYVDPVEAGKKAAVSCVKCHGDNGVSHKAGVPSLIGQHTKYFVDSAKAYQSGDRPIDENNKEMKAALDKMSEADLNHVALYFALQSDGLMRAQTPSEAGAPLTKDAVAVCARCHGETGVSTAPITPSIAGQDFDYMVKAIHAYKEGVRDDDSMGPRARKLDDDAIKNYAAFYSAMTPKPFGVVKPLSPAEWAEKCDRCHGPGGNSMRVEVPSLAGQKENYLEKALRAYQTNARTSPEMAAMSSVLTEDDVTGLAAYYSYQKPRSVVYVPVPTR